MPCSVRMITPPAAVDRRLLGSMIAPKPYAWQAERFQQLTGQGYRVFVFAG
jgi:hypothetical protein